MSENTMKLSVNSSQSLYSTTSGLTLHASESQQSSGTSALRFKKSYSDDDKLTKGDIKSYRLSATDKKIEITNDPTKKETKPLKSILKSSAPTRRRTFSSRTSTEKEKGKVTTSSRSRTSSHKTHVEKEGARRKPPLGELSESKSLLSVISKVSSRSQRSLFRDDAFRNYPVGSSFTSRGSAVSFSSTNTQMSTTSRGSRKLQKKNTGTWGSHRVSILKAQPMESELRLVKPESKEGAEERAPSRKSLKASDSIRLSDSEDEDMLEADSPDSEPEETSTDEPAERSTFLQIFDSLPDINVLSSTTTLETEELPEEKADFQYRPPIDLDSYESDISATPISSPEEVESFIAVDNGSHLSTDISLDLLIESEDEPLREPSLVKETQLDSISVLMKNIEEKKIDVDHKTSASIAINKPSLPLIDKIEAFLDDLLQQAAMLAVEPRLSRILDTEKLVYELEELAVQYKDALEENQSLDQIISGYFIKRKEFEFVDTKGDNRWIHRPRLMEAIKMLDFNLKRESETQLRVDKLLEKLRNHEKMEKRLEVQKVEHFEAKVRESLLRDGYNRLSFVINDLFREMHEVRNEVSKSRLKVATIKHQLATMEIKSKQIGDQDNGVVEYLSNQAVTQTLGAKICERNAELNRLKDRVTHDLHIITHLKEKESFGQHLLQALKDKLKSKKLRQKQLRDILQTEMVRRKRLKKATENARSGCLIPYPKLLRDYDATEDHLWAKKMVIQKLRSEHNRLERKLLQVEAGINRKTH